MRALLDTHALLWWLDGDERLSAAARAFIGDTGNAVLVSAAAAWEIATKVRIGRLPGAAAMAAELGACLASQGFGELAVTVDHGLRAGGLPGPLRDPFDRMLIAQTQAGDLALISSEAVFDTYGVRRLW